jgi:hypothetical protein
VYLLRLPTLTVGLTISPNMSCGTGLLLLHHYSGALPPGAPKDAPIEHPTGYSKSAPRGTPTSSSRNVKRHKAADYSQSKNSESTTLKRLDTEFRQTAEACSAQKAPGTATFVHGPAPRPQVPDPMRMP